jgi:hypothetical protein
LGSSTVPGPRLTAWYRRFIGTRSDEAAERTLATAIKGGLPLDDIGRLMLAAVTDHVFVDGGHTIDFTNKVFECLDLIGVEAAAQVLPTMVLQTAHASRSEEQGSWRHPHDLASMMDSATTALMAPPGEGSLDDTAVAALGWQILADDPQEVIDAVVAAHTAGATAEQLGRALAFAAALRITRFHVQNDHGDWDVVHHGFTAANGLHQSLIRSPSPDGLRGVLHGAMKVYLDRFLNVPAARLPNASAGDLSELQSCWDEQGHVDRAGGIVFGFLQNGGDPAEVIAALGRALLAEDAEFHWFQVVEAAVRQFHAWPRGSEEGALILAGTARFLAAHTPTRRELPQVVRIATRLRRGEVLFEEE